MLPVGVELGENLEFSKGTVFPQTLVCDYSFWGENRTQ